MPDPHRRARVIVALTFATTVACASPAAPPAGRDATATVIPPNAAVVRHVDGDTIIVRRGGADQRVRLIGIDTPETKKPNAPVECFGPEASAHLHDLLPDGISVRLERDVEELDAYDRVLAYVYRADDGLFVNEAMAADGYADALTIKPNNAHADTFRAVTDRARREHRGLWGACSGPHAPASG